jgi:hypothetical protein
VDDGECRASVLGDPTLYDSIRIVEAIAKRDVHIDYEVIPGSPLPKLWEPNIKPRSIAAAKPSKSRRDAGPAKVFSVDSVVVVLDAENGSGDLPTRT